MYIYAWGLFIYKTGSEISAYASKCYQNPQDYYSMLYFRRSICKIPHYNFMTAKLFVRKQVLGGCYTGIWHSQDCHGVSHYNDVIMSAMASQSPASRLFAQRFSQGADKRKHQSSASVAFVRGIHRWSVNSPHKWPINAENVSIWWRNHVTSPKLSTLQNRDHNL